LGIATISGGDCGLLADLCEDLGVPLPEVGANTRAGLVGALQKDSLVGNPLDCENLRREDRARFDTAIKAFCAEDRFDLIAFRMNLAPEPSDGLRDLYESLLGSAAAAGRMAVVLSRSAEPLGSAWFEFFEGLDVAFLPGYRTALAAIGHFLRGKAGTGSLLPGAVPEETEETEPAARTLRWEETRAWLSAAAIPHVESRWGSNPESAAAAAAELGFPVALKAVSSNLAHKSEAGGVRLGLRSATEVASAARTMAAAIPELEGFEVQAMALDGVEMILGMTRDRAVGPVLLIGVGGVLAELWCDFRLAVPPLSEGESLALIESLRGAPLLRGYRGGAACDVEFIAGLIARFSRLIVQAPELLEVDLNPLIVLPEGAVAVDALVRVRAECTSSTRPSQTRL
jgi:acyl-CoA synthetase (NDP forming)